MRIVTLLAVLSKGDAVSNDAVAVHRLFSSNGYETVLAAERTYYQPDGVSVIHSGDLSFIKEDDIVIYHLSTGTNLNYQLGSIDCRLIICYHNITPSYFFEGYDKLKTASAMEGIRGARYLAQKASLCVCDSDFNRQELVRLGYTCPMEVIPILIPFQDYQRMPDEKTLAALKQNAANIIFTGRIAPNKRQEHIIAAFYEYQKHYNPKAKLHLVGSYLGMEKYYDELLRYTEKLGLQNVFFTGHISFPGILAYYQAADLFLCMSDHEGFCVPLLEAMSFDIPVIAKESTAVAETLGNGGLLLKSADPVETAGLMHRVLTDEELKNQMIRQGRERLRAFDTDKICEMWVRLLKD